MQANIVIFLHIRINFRHLRYDIYKSYIIKRGAKKNPPPFYYIRSLEKENHSRSQYELVVTINNLVLHLYIELDGRRQLVIHAST